MRKLPFLLIILSSASALAQDQPPADPATALPEIRERLRNYARDALNRGNSLNRKAQILQLLADGADSISSFGASSSLDRARRKLEEARRIAAEAGMTDSTNAVLGAVADLWNQTGNQSADQLRGNSFLTISRLEEEYLQQSEALQREVLELQQIATGISQTQANLSAAAVHSVYTSIRARRLAAKR